MFSPVDKLYEEYMYRDEYHYGDRFDQKQREGILTIEKLQTNTEEPFNL